MSIEQALRSSQDHLQSESAKHPWRRLLLLCMLLLLSIGLNVMLLMHPGSADGPATPFVPLWLLGFLPYFAACILVLATKQQPGRWQWIELGIILLGALVLRAMLLPLPPNLSRDSWRYLWDARVTLYGYSPYVYPPNDPAFVHLRDFLYDNSRFRGVPTIYPPAAQAIYLLSYLIAPSNLFVLKGIFVGFDLATSVALALLLKSKGFDPSRCIIYAWCPLPIVEFAIQGHLDAITITFTILAVLSALSKRRGARALTGFLIALATLTKIYPIVLLVAVLRRRDWALLATCFLTIVLAYVPYLILGHGQVFGFFATYAGEHTPNAGIVQQVVGWLEAHVGFSPMIRTLVEYGTDLVVMAGTSVIILLLRYRQSLSIEAATLILIGVIFAISSHIFPWYTAALLPWVTILVGPLWTRSGGLRGKGLANAAAWYFVVASVFAYFFTHLPSWNLYYVLAYDITLAVLGVAAIAGIVHYRTMIGQRDHSVPVG